MCLSLSSGPAVKLAAAWRPVSHGVFPDDLAKLLDSSGKLNNACVDTFLVWVLMQPSCQHVRWDFQLPLLSPSESPSVTEVLLPAQLSW